MGVLIFWGIVIVVMAIAELASFQMISIWFALGAIGAFLIAWLTPLSFAWQFAAFAVSSLVLILLTRPLFKRLSGKTVYTNSELDIGKTAVVIEDISNKEGKGRARLNGVDWLAVSSEPDEVILTGEIVIIENIEGAKLIVKRSKLKQEV